MPIFLDGGPEIPENLLHAQEDGRLVFFCGAGISAAAGLPLFGSLVTQLYEKSGVTPNRIQAAAIKYKQYDVSIELLENNYIGGRIEIRNNLIEILEPDLSKEYALSMHKSLLTLSTDRQACIKLVTTNYDHLFILAENALKEKLSHPIQYFKAPVLPIPKPSKWNSIIYLHGLLPDNKNDKELDELVLSSSDFGHAYLTERWASKFISELFKNFVVCFVGYSVNDPVMRYMVDAIAADRKLGDCNKNEIFAFVPHKNNDIDSVKEE